MEEEKIEQVDVKQEELQHEFMKTDKAVGKKQKSWINKQRSYFIFFSIFIICYYVYLIDEQFNQLEEKIDSANKVIGYISKKDVANEIRSVFEENPSILASTDWNIEMLDKESKMVELTMSVLPKEYIPGMEVDFYADCSDGTKLLVKGDERESMHFVGKMKIPFSEMVNIYVSIKKGDVIQTQKILSDAVERNFVLDVHCNWDGKSIYQDGVVNVNGQVKVNTELDSRFEKNLSALKQMEVVLYVADKAWKRLPVETVQHENGYNGVSFSMNIEQDRETFSGISYLVDVRETIPLEVGESLKVTIEGQDRYGLRYRKVVGQMHFKENGDTVDEWGFTEVTEVY